MPKPQQDTDKQEQLSVRYLEIDGRSEGQRLDNFLIKELKGAPKSLVYKILRRGEVRVNKKRAKPMQKLRLGDSVRIPPVRIEHTSEPKSPGEGLQQLLRDCIVFEDDYLLVLNKPSGIAVHGGSGLSTGIIESLRSMGIGDGYLELVHRLDRDTSGCLVLAKKRSTLVALHKALREGEVKKTYQALVSGRWPRTIKKIDAPLQKNSVSSGERKVRVDAAGKQSVTHFSVKQAHKRASWLSISLDTGRTHQIRVHTQLAGHPVLGDSKYGSKEDRILAKELGVKRLFLHAVEIEFMHPESGEPLKIHSPLPEDLARVIKRL